MQQLRGGISNPAKQHRHAARGEREVEPPPVPIGPERRFPRRFPVGLNSGPRKTREFLRLPAKSLGNLWHSLKNSENPTETRQLLLTQSTSCLVPAVEPRQVCGLVQKRHFSGDTAWLQGRPDYRAVTLLGVFRLDLVCAAP